jgi:hypothetical protein
MSSLIINLQDSLRTVNFGVNGYQSGVMTVSSNVGLIFAGGLSFLEREGQRTGIYKRKIQGMARVALNGIEGDPTQTSSVQRHHANSTAGSRPARRALRKVWQAHEALNRRAASFWLCAATPRIG